MRNIIVGFVAVLALAGCGSGYSSSTPTNPSAPLTPDGNVGSNYLSGRSVVLPDGRSVTCVFFGYSGVSCDWEHIKEVTR